MSAPKQFMIAERKMVLKHMKFPYYSTILIILATFLLLYISLPTKDIFKTTKPDSGSKMLVQVLRKATMMDRTVILTVVDQEWASPGSILDLFLESFHIGHGTKPLLNHIVVIALDIKAYQYCNSIHPHCFYVTGRRYSVKKSLPLPQLKYKLFHEVILSGYNFIFTEADVMWFRNPVIHINSTPELTIACYVDPGDTQSMSNNVDGGFFYMRNNAITLQYFEYWELVRFLYLPAQNESLCEATRSDGVFEQLRLRIEYLDVAHFPGFCQQNGDMNKICTMRANCCDDIRSKIYDMKLLLADWRNFIQFSTAKTNFNVSSYTMRAPNKCKE